MIASPANSPAWLLRAGMVLFVVACAVRFAMLSTTPLDKITYMVPSPTTRPVSGDEGINIGISLLLNGQFADPFGGPSGPTAHVPPAYPVEMALLFRLFGFGTTAGYVRCAVLILGFSTVIALLPWFAHRIGVGARVGLAGGAFAACVPVFASAEVSTGRDEWLAGLLLMYLTLLAFRLVRAPATGLPVFLWFGFVWGVMMYMQPSTVLVLAAQGLLVTALVKPAARAAVLTKFAVASAVFAITISPWIIRNHSVLGVWCFMRDNMGLELAMANGPGAFPSQQENMQSGYYCKVHPICAGPLHELQSMGEVNFYRLRKEQATDWIRHNPAEFTRLTVWRSMYVWTAVPSVRSLFLVRSVLSILALAGLVVLWRRGQWRVAAMLAVTMLSFVLPYSLFMYTGRYMCALGFVIFTLAGITLDFAWRQISGRFLGGRFDPESLLPDYSPASRVQVAKNLVV